MSTPGEQEEGEVVGGAGGGGRMSCLGSACRCFPT